MSNELLHIVRQHDPDRFLLSLFTRHKSRAALWALYAFNYEIAKTREVVSDTTIGLIRLQWWRDAIAEIYDGRTVRQHEVVTPLAQAIKQYQLPRDLFDNLIYAREFDLEGAAPANLSGLIKYCELTNVPLTQLALKIIEQEDNDTAVVDISLRYALIGVIRAVPHMINSHHILLPQDILDKYDLSPQKLFDYRDKKNLPEVIDEVINGQKQLRNDQSDVFQGRLKSKFLKKMKLMTDIYERQIQAVNYDIYDPHMGLPPRFFALKMGLGIK